MLLMRVEFLLIVEECLLDSCLLAGLADLNCWKSTSEYQLDLKATHVFSIGFDFDSRIAIPGFGSDAPVNKANV